MSPRYFAYAYMNGIGNRIYVLDLRLADFAMTPEAIRALAKPRGCHFDQAMVLHAPRTPGTEAFVRIYNVDGSESAVCGNGSRCVALFLTRKSGRDQVCFETAAGLVECTRKSILDFAVDIGTPKFGWRDIPLRAPVRDEKAIDLGPIASTAGLGPASVVSVGNPHAIFWVDSFDGLDIPAIGPELERYALFPERANISFAIVRDRRAVQLRVWERGAGETKACGSAACAAAVAGARLDRLDREVRVSLPGGDLDICWRQDNRIVMTGRCGLDSEGQVALDGILQRKS